MSLLGNGGLLKPFRCLASRLLASNNPLIGTKSVGNDLVFASGDADGVFLEASSAVSSGGFDTLPSDNATHMPTAWPLQGAFNSPSWESHERPWFDMKLHQAPLASYHQSEVLQPVLSGPFANNFLMMQPMLVPVFHPFWGMQAFAEAQPAAPSQVAATMFPQEAMKTVTEQCGGPLSRAVEAVDEATTAALEETADGISGAGARRQRRARRGGAAMRKKLAGTACPEEVAELQCAVKETEPVTACGASGSSGTPERWSDYEIEDNSALSVASADTPDASSAQLQSTPSSMSEEDVGLGEAVIDPLLLELDGADETGRQFALDWVASSFWPLALTKRGCRIVQKAIEKGTPAYQHQLVENLHGRVNEAIKSPHTNYVLQKFIETMPPEHMQFVLTELQGQGLYVARHRFGCRIIQRLIEHCPPSQTEPLINEILRDASPLCRHQYGNFVVQHILQHGSPAQRSVIAEVVEADIIRLAKHRIASHVVSCAIVHCPAEDVQRLTHTVLHDAGQLADLSRREYGSFVVREVNRAARNLLV